MNLRRLESYLCLWGEIEAGQKNGLKTLNYPSSTTLGRYMTEGEGIHSRAVLRITPSYLPNHNVIELQNHIKELESEYQEVLILKYVEFNTYDQIAQRLKKHINTISKRLKKAKQRLLILY